MFGYELLRHPTGPATRCKKHGICTHSCVSECQTGEHMPAEEMVKYGWLLEVAEKHQSGMSVCGPEKTDD